GGDSMRGHCGLAAAGYVEYFDGAIAIAGPDFTIIPDQHAVRPGDVVVYCAVGVRNGALKLIMAAESQECIAVSIDHIDRIVAAVAEDVQSNRRFDKADVEWVKRLCCFVTNRNRRRWRKNLRHRRRQQPWCEQRGGKCQ